MLGWAWWWGPGGLSLEHYWRGGIKKSMIFEVFGAYLSEFLIPLVVSKILEGGGTTATPPQMPVSCEKEQMLLTVKIQDTR